MKGYALPLLVILLVGAIAGCMGGGETTAKPTASIVPNGTEKMETTGSPRPAVTTTRKEPDPGELLEGVRSIRRFTYNSNTSLVMTVTVEGNESSETDNVTLRIIERGYVDYDSWSAWINTTTISLPDGTGTETSRIIVNNVTYLRTAVGWVRIDDPAASEMVWRYSIVSLARRYLAEKPDSIEEGKILRLIYRIPDYELEPLAEAYFSASAQTSVYVSGGRLELHFRGNRLVGGRLGFDVSSVTEVSDPILGEMRITQEGSWDETFEITSVNKRIEVRPPT